MERIDIFNEKKMILESSFQLVFSNENIAEEYFIADKTKKCRFCNRSEPEVSFNDVAHAIPESLGNKYVVLLNECDECNHRFGEGIETHFDKVIKIYKNVGQVKGKNNKIPSIKSRDKTFRIDIKDDFIIKETEGYSKIIVDDDKKTITYEYEFEPFIPAAVYKTLVKIALSIMPELYLKYFKDSIEWINNPDHSQYIVTPLIAIKYFYPGPPPFTRAKVWLFMNQKVGSNNYPASMLKIGIGNITLQIVIPTQIDAQTGNDKKIPIIPHKHDYLNTFGTAIFEQVDLTSFETVRNKIVPVVYSFEQKQQLDPNSEEAKRKLGKT